VFKNKNPLVLPELEPSDLPYKQQQATDWDYYSTSEHMNT